MSQEEKGSAPGPIDTSAHTNTGDDAAGRGDRPTDERAIRLEQERAIQNGPAFAIPAAGDIDLEPPAGSVMVQELQDIRRVLTSIELAANIGLTVVCLGAGYVLYKYARAGGAVPSDVTPEGDNDNA